MDTTSRGKGSLTDDPNLQAVSVGPLRTKMRNHQTRFCKVESGGGDWYASVGPTAKYSDRVNEPLPNTGSLGLLTVARALDHAMRLNHN
jgi:hypothetical protein